MTDQTLASKLLTTLAQQDTEKRHAGDDKDTLPQVNNPELSAWLRSLAPLTERELYDASWND